MCMVDYSDGHSMTLSRSEPVARKPHKCTECRREIRVGEKYLREGLLFDGRKSTVKTCEHCQVVRSWLSDECGGWMYEGVEEDITEHAREGYGVDVIRLAVGMRRFWTTRKGELMPIPALPETSLQRAARIKRSTETRVSN